MFGAMTAAGSVSALPTGLELYSEKSWSVKAGLLMTVDVNPNSRICGYPARCGMTCLPNNRKVSITSSLAMGPIWNNGMISFTPVGAYCSI